MATSPSDPGAAPPGPGPPGPLQPVPPEVIAIAVALAVTMFEPAADAGGLRVPDVRPWRWQGWD